MVALSVWLQASCHIGACLDHGDCFPVQTHAPGQVFYIRMGFERVQAGILVLTLTSSNHIF